LYIVAPVPGTLQKDWFLLLVLWTGGKKFTTQKLGFSKTVTFLFFQKNDKQTVDRWRREQGDCPRTLRVTATADDGGDDDDDGSN